MSTAFWEKRVLETNKQKVPDTCPATVLSAQETLEDFFSPNISKRQDVQTIMKEWYMILKCQELLKFMATVSYFELLHTYNTMHSVFSAVFQRKSNTSYFNIQNHNRGTHNSQNKLSFFYFLPQTTDKQYPTSTMSNTKNRK